jgi:hypothetical protein
MYPIAPYYTIWRRNFPVHNNRNHGEMVKIRAYRVVWHHTEIGQRTPPNMGLKPPQQPFDIIPFDFGTVEIAGSIL